MSYKKLRETLIRIPIIEKAGTLRRNLLHPQKTQSIDMEEIRQIYANGKHNGREPVFIVYSNQPQGGLFVYLMDCMAQIAYAVQQGYVPVVDMLNFPNNLRNESQKEINAWELYFQQPMGISVPEVYGAEEIHFHNDVAEKYIDEKYQSLFEGKKKTLGLLCRGTDYLSLKPRGHYIQPTRDMIVEKVQCVMKETEWQAYFYMEQN